MKRASASTGIFPGTKPGWAAPTLIVPAMVCVKTWPPLASLSEGIGIVAVGTTVTRRPPHRSVLAELLHTAPASGSDAIALRWIAWRVRVCLRVPSTHFPGSVSGVRENQKHSLWLSPFPPSPPPGCTRCSASSSVLWGYPTSLRRGWRDYGFPSPPRPTMFHRAPMRPPSSCSSSFPACSGSTTAWD